MISLQKGAFGSQVVTAGGIVWLLSAIVATDQIPWPYVLALGIITLGLAETSTRKSSFAWTHGAAVALIVLGLATLIPALGFLTAWIVLPLAILVGPVAVAAYAFVQTRAVVSERPVATVIALVLVVNAALLPVMLGSGNRDVGILLLISQGVLWFLYGMVRTLTAAESDT